MIAQPWGGAVTKFRPRTGIATQAGAACVWRVALLCSVCGVSAAQEPEIAPFRLTGVEGHNTVRYMRDELSTTQPGSGPVVGARSRQGQSDFREELFVMTHSYVVHPNFLSMDIGGGPILQRGNYLNDAEETRSQGGLYNFTGRAKFLQDKPYQGSVFYDHLNPTLSVAPGQVITQENTRYGADFSLLAPVTPVPMYVDATRSHFQGRGADRVIDDQIDRVNLRASRSFGALGSTQFQYQSTQQASMSGSPNLPIQSSHSNNQGLSLDTRLQLGPTRQYDLANLITLNSQAYTLQGQNSIPERQDGRMFLDLRGRHSKELQSYGYYNYSASDQGEASNVVHSIAAGLNYAPRPEWTSGIGIHGDDSRLKQLASNSRGVDGSLRYQRSLPVGVAQVSYGLRHDQREQKATATQTSVVGERVVLAGTAFAALGQRHLVAGSLAVSNVTRTQTFVEGQDYTLMQVGAETRLQRQIGGAILEGQELLLDYAYAVGGSFAYNQTDQTLNLNWALKSYINTYFRYLDAEPRLSSGTPAYALNVVRSSLYGVRADVPLRLGVDMTWGGNLEREHRRETVAPYRREARELYVQTEDPFFGSGNIRASMRRTRVAFESAAQDVDLQGYDLRYWARLRSGIDLSANVSYESDTGGTAERRRMITSAKAQWLYRKMNLNFDLGRTLESQGEFKRSRALVQITARRDF